ncbi:MAG: carbohydrate-binding protein [Methylococcaceae bacterium]|nr:carbohydrate-binding protein [Methylococcaceae bacterium]
MRKRIINPLRKETAVSDRDWLNIASLAEVEITSEDAEHPIEDALLADRAGGWRASEPGIQTIRLIFELPQRLSLIKLDFVETGIERTQQYVLRWSTDGESFTEIVRQQWNFSRLGASFETEEHHVDLPAVAVLELCIIPDIGGAPAVASLAQLRLA